ncbi:MAG TPA: glycosyltransferase family 2 protein [Candidatus Polarisedimenticolia bacterium]|nr:glycosyltransferase family 2 protein [Candidatus Polarisedimenticolia bacterium]
MSNAGGPSSVRVLAAGAPPPEISVVVPLYNERDNVSPLACELIPVLETLGRSFEVVFVNDGSTDGSEEPLRALRQADRRVRILTLERNSGQTAALSAGFAAARGETVLTLDADLQNDARDIPRLLGMLEGCDAVVGWRGSRRDSWLRRISSRIANAVRNALSDDDIIDTGCSLKAYRREALARIKLYTGMHRFIPTLLRMEGYVVRQVEVGHRPRHAGESKYNIRNRILRSFVDLLAVRWMKRRMLRYNAKEE